MSDATWNLRFEELTRFHDQHGHVLVPACYALNPELPVWLAAQRTRLASLTRTQARRLWELGVRFPRWESRWLFQFFKLVDGREQFGDVNNPRIWEHDPSLKTWIRTQRTLRGRRLAPYRRRWLDEIGFIWNVDDAMWERRLAEWQGYVRETGGQCIPNESGHRLLAQWTRFQRLQRRRGKLSADKIRRLDATGFAWNLPRPTSGSGTSANWSDSGRFTAMCALAKLRAARTWRLGAGIKLATTKRAKIHPSGLLGSTHWDSRGIHAKSSLIGCSRS